MSESGIQIKILLALTLFVIGLVQSENEEGKAFALSDLLLDNNVMVKREQPIVNNDDEITFARNVNRRFAFGELPTRGKFAFAFAKRNFQDRFGTSWQFAKKSSFA